MGRRPVYLLLLGSTVMAAACAAAPTKLAITSITSTPTDVAPFSVTVVAQDGSSAPANVVANTTVAMALINGNGNLFGSLIAVIPAGQNNAVFTNVNYDLPESGVVLTVFATAGDTLTNATSAPITVNAGPATALGAIVPSGTSNATVPFSLNIRAIDAQQNPAPVAADTTVSVSLAAGSGVLGGTLSGIIHAGTSSISLPITYSKPEANVRLRVTRSAGDVLQSTTTFFNVADNANKLFAFAPLNATTGAPFTLQVNAIDTDGNSAPVTASTTITVTKASGFGTLGGTLTAVIPAGTSTVNFTNVTYDVADTVKLTITPIDGDALGTFTTSAFQVAVPPTPPTKLQVSAFGPITSGAPFTLRVLALDSSSNTKAVRSDTNVTITLKTGTGTLSGILTGTITAGTFVTQLTAVAYSIPENGVVVTATASGGDALSAADSTPFNVLGAPTAVMAEVFDLPSANAPFDVSITAIDGSGSPTRVLADTMVSINAAPAAGTGTFGGTLTGTIPAGSSSIDLLNVTYSKAESNVALTATSAGLTSGTSTPFNVSPAATKLLVSAPTPGTPAATLPFSITVTAADNSNLPAKIGADTLITLTKNAGAGTLSGTVAGTIRAGNNFVTIYGLTYSQADNGVTLTATGAGLTPGTSSAFTVASAPVPGAPARIDIRSGNSQSAPAGTSVAIPPTVFVRDANSIPVAGATVTFSATAGAGSVSGATVTTDAQGLAQVGSWTLGIIGGKNTLQAVSNGISVNIAANATGGTGPLLFSSAPSATPNPAGVGQTVQFSAAINLPGTFTWQFGDGASDVSGNAASSHAYSAPGTYALVVTASSPPQSITGNLSIVVNAPLVGVGNDSDGDGFSDGYEIAAGTNPNDPASAPFSTAGLTPVPLSQAKIGVHLNFAKAHNDTLTLSGILPVPIGLKIAGAQFGISVGSFSKTFLLNTFGRGKSGSDTVAAGIKIVNGKAVLQNSKFSIKLSKEDLAAALDGFGLSNADVKNKVVTVDATIVFGGAINQTHISTHYSAKKDHAGATSK